MHSIERRGLKPSCLVTGAESSAACGLFPSYGPLISVRRQTRYDGVMARPSHWGKTPDMKPAGITSVDFNQAPFLVIWEMTRACALACVHCRADAIARRDPRELTTNEGRRLIDQVRAISPRPLFVLTGGDPMRRPDLAELVRYAADAGLTVALTPSGTAAATRERLAALKDAGLSRVAVSLDGPTPGEPRRVPPRPRFVHLDDADHRHDDRPGIATADQLNCLQNDAPPSRGDGGADGRTAAHALGAVLSHSDRARDRPRADHRGRMRARAEPSRRIPRSRNAPQCRRCRSRRARTRRSQDPADDVERTGGDG